ncbi:MAG: hypothetical protein C0592_08065 [Marinilabiliales bacterium]|nr:MAG: hypothetical protein C0592_08065 [Marinilabiliales bacterium]
MSKKAKKRIWFGLIAITLIILCYFNFETIRSLFEENAKWYFPDEKNAKGEFLKIILQALAGIAVILGVFYSFKRSKAMELGVEKQAEQIELSRKSQVDERFKNAIEHLGSDKEPIILGGVVELHQIAIDNEEKYAQVVFNILNSYIRSNTNIYKVDVEDIKFIVIQTIVDLIFKEHGERNPFKDFKANLSFCNLSSIDFSFANLSHANLSFSILPKFKYANLSHAKLSKVAFVSSEFERVNFDNADLFDVSFEFVKIKECSFNNTKIWNTHFFNSEITKCLFNSIDSHGLYYFSCEIEENTISNSTLLDFRIVSSNIIKLSINNIKYIHSIIFIACFTTSTEFDSTVKQFFSSGCNMVYIVNRLNTVDNINKRIGLMSVSDDIIAPIFSKRIWETNELSERLAQDYIELFEYVKKEHKIRSLKPVKQREK